MSTDVEICNISLSLIGESPIVSLAGTDNVSKTCNVHFQQAVDWVLSQRNWRSAITRASLSTPDGTPVYGWAHYYDYPADCLRVLEVRTTELEDDSVNGTRWASEGRTILSDSADGIKVRYIKSIAITDIPTHVVDVVALEVARRIVIPITNSNKMRQSLSSMMFGEGKADKGWLAEAAAVDGQQGRTRVLRTSKLVGVRMQNTSIAGPYV